MKKAMVLAACVLALMAALCMGCSSGSSSSSASASASGASATASTQSSASGQGDSQLAAGVYTVDVDTDSSMFHVNESKDGKGELTVSEDGTMSVHMTLVSKRITNLYAGTADEAKANPDGVIEPTTDKVTYSDGYEEEVYGFDVPVPALDEGFAVAILGEKGSWYDHEVTISNPVKE